MLSVKNLNPQQLSAITALIIALPISVAIYYFQPLWMVAVITFVIIFLGSYGLILFMVQQFVYRKIKLIYKLIYQTKASKREEFYYKNILPQKSIDEVRIDVENWGLQKKAQIEILQQNEAYRKEFLQNLSHELKTPIFAIQGYVDTLVNGALENPAVNKKFLASTSRNIDRLVNLVDDLDEISKLEADGGDTSRRDSFERKALDNARGEQGQINSGAFRAPSPTIFVPNASTPGSPTVPGQASPSAATSQNTVIQPAISFNNFFDSSTANAKSKSAANTVEKALVKAMTDVFKQAGVKNKAAK